MAKLFSKEDQFHVHAFLGFAALIHFCYRIAGLFMSWTDSFDESFFSAGTLSIHVLLHATSFQFHLPSKRITTKPIIWSEFRLHNAIFSYRHLIGAALGILFPEWWWKNPGAMSLIVKMVLVAAAMKAADVVTENYGSQEVRTTNGMPYPENTSKELQQTAKWFYAKSQFGATATALFCPPVLSFINILAIEIASFLMTLVRKGIILPRTYHIIYGASLAINFPAGIVLAFNGHDELLAVVRMSAALCLSIELRMLRNKSKYLAWVFAVIAGGLFGKVVEVVPPVLVQGFLVLTVSWSILDTILKLRAASFSEHLQAPEKKPHSQPGLKTVEAPNLSDKTSAAVGG